MGSPDGVHVPSHAFAVDGQAFRHVRHRLARRARGLNQRRERRPLGLPAADRPLVFLHHAREIRGDESGRAHGGGERPGAPGRDCACAASMTIRRRALTPRQPRTASATTRRAPSCRAHRSGSRTRTRPRRGALARCARAGRRATPGQSASARRTAMPLSPSAAERPGGTRALDDGGCRDRVLQLTPGSADARIPGRDFQAERDRRGRLQQGASGHTVAACSSDIAAASARAASECRR